MLSLYEQTRSQASIILSNLQGLVTAWEAYGVIVADSEPFRRGLQELQSQLSAQSGLGPSTLVLLLFSGALVVLLVWAWHMFRSKMGAAGSPSPICVGNRLSCKSKRGTARQ